MKRLEQAFRNLCKYGAEGCRVKTCVEAISDFSLLVGNYSGRQNELQNGGQEPRNSLFGEPSMAAFNASKRLFFCLRIVDR
jgi:hypothetical protein